MKTLSLNHFCKEHNLNIMFSVRLDPELQKTLGKHYCSFDPKYFTGTVGILNTKEDGTKSLLLGVIGNGDTMEAAEIDLINQFSGKTLEVWKISSYNETGIDETIEPTIIMPREKSSELR